MTLRSTVKSLTPPALLPVLRRLGGGGLRFGGQPADWADAQRQSTGYDERQIVERVAAATRAVVAGTAAFERDSVLFDRPDPPFPVITALLRSAALNAGRLEVIDFGGSLGSLYRRCRPFLGGLASLQWRVVEQPQFVAAGRAEFATAELSFFERLDELPHGEVRPLALAACVLQYLERPAATLRDLQATGAHLLVIDRVPLADCPADRLCIQSVPASIYAASYPCWVFARDPFMRQLQANWRLLADYHCDEGACVTDDGLRFEFRGLILERAA